MRKEKQEDKLEEEIEKEAIFGVLPITTKQKKYGFLDALLVLGGYCIATWSYTQGSYLTSLVGFKQLLIGAFLGAILMLAIYQLPVILSVRYGIDIWIWLRSVFGHHGVKVMTIIIIVINFPWYAVCADLFASSMSNMLKLVGIQIPQFMHPVLGIFCVLLGTFIAYKGIGAITWTTRIMVPLLIGVGVVVMIVGFTSVPVDVIWNYVPKDTGYENNLIPYIISMEANFAFVITLVGGMAEIPRLSKTEKSGYWAGVLGQGLIGSFFVVIGAVMAIAMEHVTGTMVDDPTIMLATLSVPALALCSLLLVGFANVGTQAVGSYIYGVMLKSSFQKANYKVLLMILAGYVTLLCIWGKIVTYFGSFLTISACVYAPLAALLFVDFFLIRKQKLSLRDAYRLPGYDAYDYHKGFNLVGLFCVAAGVAMSLAIYNPVTGEVHNMFLFHLTPTGFSFIGTGLLYWLLCEIPGIREYVHKDKKKDTIPFDRDRMPPKQNFFFMPLMWLYCLIMTAGAKLTIKKERMEGLKPPFLVFGTHHAFMDFCVTPLALFPYRANYVSELEGFEAYGEWLYRQIGCLGTRKFVDDLELIRNIKRVLNRKGILVVYPEARYANVGTSTGFPLSVAKMAKKFDVPVVTINMHGNYLQSPIWNLKKRKEAKLSATITQVYTREELKQASIEEIQNKLVNMLSYDEYKWQEDQHMAITYDKRAEGIELPLYQCPVCGTEFQMQSKGTKLWCNHCKHSWIMNEYGKMCLQQAEADQNGRENITDGRNMTPEQAEDSCSETMKIQHMETFSHIPNWYEWEREQVKQEIDEHKYHLDCKVRIESLPNAINFIDCGKGHLTHGEDGYSLTFTDYEEKEPKTLTFKPNAMFSVHTEYDYRGKGQCITLSTLDNTYFLFPLEQGFNATKIQFATEYLYQLAGSKS